MHKQFCKMMERLRELEKTGASAEPAAKSRELVKKNISLPHLALLLSVCVSLTLSLNDIGQLGKS